MERNSIPRYQTESARLFEVAAETKSSGNTLADWTLTSVRALAIDPDPALRLQAAKSKWVGDARLQFTLASDPCETVVLALLDRVDLGLGGVLCVLNSDHVEARRRVAQRNLPSRLLLEMTNDHDPVVARTAGVTLHERLGAWLEATS